MTGQRGRYALYGLSISSSVPLPERRRLADDGPVDLTVSVGDRRPVPHEPPVGRVVVDLDEDRHYYSGAVDDDGRHVLRFYGTCDVTIDPGLATATIHPGPTMDDDLINVLLVGSILSYILTLRGHLVLHASAVELDGQALAFVGASGMGKSTLATLLCADGATLVTDDVLRVDLDTPPRCHLGATEARLRKAAGDLAERFATQPGHRLTGDDRTALALPHSHVDRLHLTRLIVPAPRPGATTSVRATRLEGASALMGMLSFPRLLGWQDREVLSRQVQQLGELVEQVPVYVAELPWGPPFPNDLASSLLEQVGVGLPTT